MQCPHLHLVILLVLFPTGGEFCYMGAGDVSLQRVRGGIFGMIKLFLGTAILSVYPQRRPSASLREGRDGDLRYSHQPVSRRMAPNLSLLLHPGHTFGEQGFC